MPLPAAKLSSMTVAAIRQPLIRLGVRLEAIAEDAPDWLDSQGRARIEGARHSLAWRIDTPFLGADSSVNLGVNYLYNDQLEVRVGQGDLTTLRTSIGYSKHQATTNLTYKNRGLAWQWQFQYIGKAKNDPDAPPETYQFPVVDDVLFVNSSVNYDVTDNFRVSFIVDNVFDTKNPFPTPANGGVVTYFDGVRGRYFKVGAGVKF